MDIHEEVCKYFELYDFDGGGKISMKDLKDRFALNKHNVSSEDLISLMKAMDKNRDFMDVKIFLTDKMFRQIRRETFRLFHHYDFNNQQKICMKDLKDRLDYEGIHASYENLKSLMNEMDINGDGYVNIEDINGHGLHSGTETTSIDMAIRSESYKSLELDATKDHASGTPLALLNLSSMWERSILKNEKLLLSTRKNDPVTIFHGSKAPKLSIKQYMERIFKYSQCSPSCFVIAQIYMDRFFQKRGGYLTSFNAHRLLITSVMVAAKFLDDKYYSNAYYAKVGGVSTEEMNRMEMEFLFNLEFRLFVTTELFLKYCEKLDRAV